MTSIGETLRRERLRRDLELEQISRELKISPRFLQAIESDRFENLPGGVFAKSFVRQYARYLSLDEEEFASAVRRALEPPVSPTPPPEPTRGNHSEIPLPRVQSWDAARPFSSSLPALAMVVVVMLVCSGIYSWWQRSRRPISANQETPAPAVQVTQAPALPSQPPADTPQLPADGAATRPETEPLVPAVSQQGSAERPADLPAPTQTAAMPVGTAAPISPAAATPRGPVRLEVTADQPVWVLVRADGKFLFSGTIDTNQTRQIDAIGTVLLRLGNAGAVRISLNGKPLGAVGQKGQVRTVQFTSGGFQIVSAPSPVVPFDPL